MKAEQEFSNSFKAYKAWIVSKLYSLLLAKIYTEYLLKLKYIQMSPKDQFLIMFEKGNLDDLFVWTVSIILQLK